MTATPETHELELDSDPFDDNLSELLADAAPRPLVNRTTLILSAVVLALGGFITGALVQKHYGTTGTPSATRGANAGTVAGGNFAGGGRANGGNGNGAANATPSTAGGATMGVVKLIDGTTVYIETPDGRLITVRTTTGTTVLIGQPGALKDLGAGSTVTIEGSSTGADTVTANRITKG